MAKMLWARRVTAIAARWVTSSKAVSPVVAGKMSLARALSGRAWATQAFADSTHLRAAYCVGPVMLRPEL